MSIRSSVLINSPSIRTHQLSVTDVSLPFEQVLVVAGPLLREIFTIAFLGEARLEAIGVEILVLGFVEQQVATWDVAVGKLYHGKVSGGDLLLLSREEI